MREACKYVEEKLATKVLMLQYYVNNMCYYYLIKGQHAWSQLNGLFNVSLKFSAQNFNQLMKIVVMISLGRKAWQGFPDKLCKDKHVF